MYPSRTDGPGQGRKGHSKAIDCGCAVQETTNRYKQVGGGRPIPPPCMLERFENLASKNSPSFAVALNCGMGSTSLNADVNALERLQIVRDRNSSYFGLKYRSCTVRARCFGASSLPSTNAS